MSFHTQHVVHKDNTHNVQDTYMHEFIPKEHTQDAQVHVVNINQCKVFNTFEFEVLINFFSPSEKNLATANENMTKICDML